MKTGKMNILLINHEYPPHITSGPGRYATTLVDELAKSGHYVTVITPLIKGYGGERYEKKKNIEIYRIPLVQSKIFDRFLPDLLNKRYLFNIALSRFAKTVDFSKYDLMHIADEHVSFFLKEDTAKNIPVVISVNSYYHLETPWNILKFPYPATDLPLRYLYYMINKAFIKKKLPLAKKVICNTRYNSMAVLKYTKTELSKVRVIYRGKDAEFFDVEPAENKYVSKRILFIGGNMERKGVKYLVMAMPFVLKRFPEAKLVLVGKCSWLYKKILSWAITKHNLKNNVEFIEFVKPEDVPGLFKEANVFAMTPIIENLAQVIMEAMATRTPVVCTDVGANKECVADKEHGFLVKPKDVKGIADAVIAILNDKELAKKMGENGRKRIKEMFNKDKMVSETIKIYKEACENNEARRNKEAYENKETCRNKEAYENNEACRNKEAYENKETCKNKAGRLWTTC